MVTRLYFHAANNGLSNLPTTEQSSLTSGKNADAQTVNRLMDTTIGTAQTSIATGSLTQTSIQRLYWTRFVSQPLSGITSISANTWTYNFASLQSATSANFPANTSTPSDIRVMCYVWRPGTGYFATILDGNTNTASYRGFTTERCQHGSFSGVAVSGVQDGDVICLEMWFEITQGTAASFTDTIYFDGTTVNTTTATVSSNHASFLETPQNLTFSAALTRVSLSRIYKYNIFNRISQSRIYKYQLLNQVLSSRIYRYALKSRVTLARIYRYGLNSRLSLSRIYLYKLQARISLSRLYRYAITAQVLSSRIYRYKLQSRISLARIYRYGLIARVSDSNIYKYNIFAKISLARIYRYNIQSRLSLSRIYRYNLLKQIFSTQIYKYNIIGRVLNPDIYRYKILNRFTTPKIYRYRLLNKVSLARIYRYNIFKKVLTSRTYKYNLLNSISSSLIYRYAITARLSLSQIYRYGIISTLLRASKNVNYIYNIKARLGTSRTFKYNILNKVSLPRLYLYNILQRVGTFAIQLPTVSAYLNLGNDAALWSQSKAKFSFSLWIKPDALNTGSYQNIINHNWQTTGSFILYFANVGYTPVFALREVAAQKSAAVAGSIADVGQWIHFVGVYDSTLGSANIKLYKNKVLGGTTGNATEAMNQSSNLVIGTAASSPPSMVKDFRWYTTKALTQQEINDICDNLPTAPTPDYWLKMEKSSGSPTDSITGTKTATLTNGAKWASAINPIGWQGRIQKYLYNIFQKLAITQQYSYQILQKATLLQTYLYNIIQRVGRPLAIHFDGVDDSIFVGNNAAINNLDNFSISVWIYPTSTSGASTAHIYIKRYASTNGFILYFATGSLSLNWRTTNNIGTGVSITTGYIQTNGANKWYHITVTMNRASGLQQLFINGILQGANNNTGMAANSIGFAEDMTINGAGGVKWTGHIKDFRLWRSELTQSDINKVYANDSTAPTPNYWLKMEDTPSTSTIDSINGYVASLINGPTRVLAAPVPWLAKMQTYLYNIFGRIVKPQIYKYKIIQRLLSSRIYRYNIFQKASIVRIYRYNIAQKVPTLVRTYRYKITGRMRLSRTYKYVILIPALLQQTYNYKIIGRTRLPNIYRYTIKTKTSLTQSYLYNIFAQVLSSLRYRYHILTEVSTPWSVAGKLTDFPSRLDGLVIDYVVQEWQASDPAMKLIPPPVDDPMINQRERVTIGNFDFDKFRSYYIRVRERPAQMVNRVRPNLMEFNTPIEFECSVRKLKKGEAFMQLQNMINELIRIFLMYQRDDVFGIQAIDFETITPLKNKETLSMHQSNKTIWTKTLRIVLHYHKVKRLEVTG